MAAAVIERSFLPVFDRQVGHAGKFIDVMRYQRQAIGFGYCEFRFKLDSDSTANWTAK